MNGTPMQGSDSRSYGHMAHGNVAYYSPYQSLGDSAKKAKTEEKMMRYNAIISHHPLETICMCLKVRRQHFLRHIT
jgi:hypothetical protein